MKPSAPPSSIRDNHSRGKAVDFLKPLLSDETALSIVSAYFTIHAYQALKEQLDPISELRFLFGDPKFVNNLDKERALCEALNAFKAQADEKLSQNAQLLQNEDFAERELLRLAVAQFNTTHHFGFDATTMKDISKMVFKEYLDESKGKVPA